MTPEWIAVDWIAVDWGTSHLRAFAMGPAGVLDERTSDQGMGKLKREGFEPALLALIAEWLGAGAMQIVVCGMACARQGWIEAPYRPAPCVPVAKGAFIAAPTLDPRLNVQILPGLSQAKPADVMRGEETQIAGALALHPAPIPNGRRSARAKWSAFRPL